MTLTDSLSAVADGYRGPDPASVDLWWAALTDLQPVHHTLLNPAERDRADGYLRRLDRERFVLGVALTRSVLAAAVNVSPERIGILRDCPDCDRPHGRPRLMAQDVTAGAPLDFSLSHSGERLVLAVARGTRIGVDLEQVLPAADLPSVAAKVLTPRELRDVYVGDEFQVSRFFTHWVAKESAVKATGAGLRTPMQDVSITDLDAAVSAIEFADRPGSAATVVRVAAPDGYLCAATVLQGEAPSLCVRRAF